jgi:hypothetical protein
MKNKDQRSKMERAQDLKEQIIKYWDKAGICSFDSSSCAGDPYLASCNNFIESRLLEEFIEKECPKDAFGIDIGAGLGRFTVVLARHLNLVHSLEPAKNIYYKLADNCAEFNNVKIFDTDFESFNTKEKYDIAVVSGLLYLYPDNMVHEFFEKLVNHLKQGGVVVIRDFIVKKGVKKVPSSYIEEGFCYYRDSRYWKTVAKSFNFSLTEVFQSKPPYPFKRLLWLYRELGLTRIFSVNFVKKMLYRNVKVKKNKGSIDFSSEIPTVFIVMRKQ